MESLDGPACAIVPRKAFAIDWLEVRPCCRTKRNLRHWHMPGGGLAICLKKVFLLFGPFYAKSRTQQSQLIVVNADLTEAESPSLF